MNEDLLEQYKAIRGGKVGFYEQKRGLIQVSGKEAEQFLNGLITNDVAKLESYRWMSAAFPNAQGRLLASVRVLRIDKKFLFETDEPTHEKVFQNLFRFTFAGDFKVEDLTRDFSFFSVRGTSISDFKYKIPVEQEIIGAEFDNGESGYLIKAFRAAGFDVFVPGMSGEDFADELKKLGVIEISEETQEILRVEDGVPKYGIDADETTIVPELGDDAISYNKGCYIGQEIIARIHFRGHVAKKLTGLILGAEAKAGDELKSAEGKNAGKITSVVFSPTLEKFIALAFVRYDFLSEGTELKIGERTATVKNLPFV